MRSWGEVGLFGYTSSIFSLVYSHFFYDTMLMMMVAMRWSENIFRKRSVIFKRRWRQKIYIDMLSLTPQTIAPSFLWSTMNALCTATFFCLRAWDDITWRNIHVYKFCSLYHSWTLELKKWARNINIVIEWIDERAFLPLFEVIAYIRVYWRIKKIERERGKYLLPLKNVKFFIRLRGKIKKWKGAIGWGKRFVGWDVLVNFFRDFN